MNRKALRVLAAWLPDWPVQRLRLERPDLRGRAVVLTAGDGRSERVAACSPEALALGVASGMRTPDAEALVGPGRLEVLPHQPGADLRALKRLAIGGERFAPVVALEDADEPTALLLDVTGVAPLWGATPAAGERRLADAVGAWLRDRRLVVAIAVGPTVGLALAATRHGGWLGLSGLGPHHLPTYLTEPTGPTEPMGPAEPMGMEGPAGVAARLPVEALRLAPTIVATLGGLGVETVGQLAALPRPSLAARFGEGLAWRLDQLLGTSPEPLVSHRGEPPLRERWPFETAVSHAETLGRTVGALLDRLAEAMRRRRCGATRVLVTYHLDTPAAAPAEERVVLRLFRPTASARELRELAELQASGLRFRHAVKEVVVLVGATAELDTRQRTLFDDDARDDPHELALLINRLANRVGVDRVCRVEKRRSFDPERSYGLTPATDTPARRFDLAAGQAERARRLPLAMYGGRRQPVGVVAGDDGRPRALLDADSGRARHRVVRTWGPERVETGWWRGRGVRRDAWWVELEDGSRRWLCQDLRSGRWSLAGEFF